MQIKDLINKVVKAYGKEPIRYDFDVCSTIVYFKIIFNDKDMINIRCCLSDDIKVYVDDIYTNDSGFTDNTLWLKSFGTSVSGPLIINFDEDTLKDIALFLYKELAKFPLANFPHTITNLMSYTATRLHSILSINWELGMIYKEVWYDIADKCSIPNR